VSENVYLDYMVLLKKTGLWFDDIELDEAVYMLEKYNEFSRG